jgi:nicotinamidase-related amidase
VAPEKTAVAVVDMLNPYDHEDAEPLARSVESVVEPIRSLIGRAGDEGIEVIYVNDNYDDWTSSQEALQQNALSCARPDLVEPILPPEEASFVIKARHSIFYGTPLEYLLSQREIDHLVLVGQVTEQCILYSALDAYVRHVSVTVPRDGVACIHPDLADAAMKMMERNMGAELSPCAECTMTPGRKR